MKILAGFLGLSGVALGAFGAHALKADLAALAMTATWATAVQYQLLHAVALLALALTAHLQEAKLARWLQRAAWAWAAGVVLFSGSLYWLALGGPRFLGPITPVGGLFLFAGWLCVMIGAGASQSMRANH